MSNKEEENNFHMELVDLVEEYRKKLSPQELTACLIGSGVMIVLQTAPDTHRALEHIKTCIKTTVDFHMEKEGK